MSKITRRDFIKSSIGLAATTPFLTSDVEDGLAKIEKEGFPDLAVAKDGSPEALTQKALELLGGMKRFVSKGDIVVVKPNIGWDRNPEQAADTNPEVVAEVVRLCLEAGAKKVKVFDNPCNTAKRCYENSGIKKAASEAGAEVSYVVDFGFVNTKLPEGVKLKSWDLYKPALDCDVLINLPIAKHHGLTRLTLGMKNLMGIMGGNRGKIHWDIDQYLADLSNFVRPRLTILDGVRVLLRNGPQGGSLEDVKRLDTIVVGENIASVDAYGATLFDIKPSDLGFVKLGGQLDLGEINLERLWIEEKILS